MSAQTELFRQQIHDAGIPDDFSIVASHQIIPAEILNEIDHFIEVFEQVTTRSEWVSYMLNNNQGISAIRRHETCFFSAWDIHIPPEHPERWQLIEFNDNGSGFLFAGLLNSIYYQNVLVNHDNNNHIIPPPPYSELCRIILNMLKAETDTFFDQKPDGMMLILDDAASLNHGKFSVEHQLMATIGREAGWETDIESPESLQQDRERLTTNGKPTDFVINRSTDFLWQSKELQPLVKAYNKGNVYIAPNPFSYITRSDKQLLQFLSRPDWDEILAIKSNERTILSRHIPKTYLLDEDNLSQLAEHKSEYVFKPTHGHASLGILNRNEVGKHRLQQLISKKQDYVAQHIAEKSELIINDYMPLWADLRVWAYKGKRYQLSGRASVTKERLDLSPPGGWLPTFAATE
ncbi:hypothetical protein C942_01963 [Photobacterium marinum]|uniref:Glutathionylspermidine synthase pre-ATP-grasp-like domain-containing protein n=1 Tax=Photobacterium marinum TaxID=1056511 RepID=L8J9J2_9GAMM|nr:hypothetical protein [Photobacterium marinum]ELR64873.1 hypothetical protein C942_01963 [Photobacterium marinum]